MYLHVRFSSRRNSQEGGFSKLQEVIFWELESTSRPNILAMWPRWQWRIQGLWLWLGLRSAECSTHGEEETGAVHVSSSKMSSVSLSISIHIPWCHRILKQESVKVRNGIRWIWRVEVTCASWFEILRLLYNRQEGMLLTLNILQYLRCMLLECFLCIELKTASIVPGSFHRNVSLSSAAVYIPSTHQGKALTNDPQLDGQKVPTEIQIH